MSRRRTSGRSSVLVLTGAALLVTGCTSTGPAPTAAEPPPTSGGPLVASTLVVPDGLAEGPFDEPRQVLAPDGWSVSLWARVPTARLAAWAPDGTLLISRPKSGDVLALTPGSGAEPPAQRTLLSGLDQPHGLTFAGSTLYVAESDQVDAYRYDAGAVTERQTVVAGCPTPRATTSGARTRTP